MSSPTLINTTLVFRAYAVIAAVLGMIGLDGNAGISLGAELQPAFLVMHPTDASPWGQYVVPRLVGTVLIMAALIALAFARLDDAEARRRSLNRSIGCGPCRVVLCVGGAGGEPCAIGMHAGRFAVGGGQLHRRAGQGHTVRMRLATAVKYSENMQDAAIDKGVLRTPLTIDFHRSLLDTDACETFTEVIVTDANHPYVLGVRLKLAAGRVGEIETLVTDKDDWLFNADSYLKYSRGENWSVIPRESRATRATRIAAANAYEDIFFDNSVKVPWGTPCNRLEGGMRTGKGTPEDTCNSGVSSGMKITNRRFVVDPDIGAVVVLSRFSNNELPDSHLFRLENGKIRYVHTITVCTIPGCGFQRPAQPQK